MRLTLVSPFDPRPRRPDPFGGHAGGVERVFDALATELARRGHDVTVVCSTSDGAGDRREDGVRFVRARRRATILRAPIARLAPYVTSDADLVHVAATYPLSTHPVLRRARRVRVPAVLDFHFEPDSGTLAGRAAARAYRFLDALLDPGAARLADVVLVRSRAYARAVPSLSRVPEERWRVVPNGIDIGRFRPDGPRAEGPYVLFVGRLVPYKGLGVLLEALPRLPSRIPLLVVGDGPLRPALEQRARRLGVAARFLGHVADADLPALYRGARLTVLPSVTRQEAFGIVLLESMACGTPVVASDLPGVAEVARLGGLAAPPGDALGLTRMIHRALQPGAVPRGPALAEPVRRAFAWPAVVDRLERVYAEVLTRRHRSASEVAAPAHPGGHPVL